MINSITSALGGMQREVKRFETSTRELAVPQTSLPSESSAQTGETPAPSGLSGLETSVSLPLPDVERIMPDMLVASELYKANINVIETSDEMMKRTLDMKV